ncbi:hypothetical protein ACIPLC_10685 [Kitasatospora sp. NPDC086801]|uniref:hypothetical protein n=1 Tax=Kitasatospora sp. NPDC086801 TaxID=3364066 RepID=UPI0037F22A95
MVAEEKRGEAGRTGAGFQLPEVNWALAAEAEPAEGASATGTAEGTASAKGEAAKGEAAEAGSGAATAVLPAQAERERPATPPAVPPVPAPDTATAAAARAAAAPTAAGTPEAVAAASVAEPTTDTGTDQGPRPGRVSRPMIAAAVAVGLVLVGTSVVVTQLGGNEHKGGPAQADAPPGYGQSGGDGGNGFVPNFDEHGGTSGSGGSPAPGQPDAAVPAADAGTGTPTPGDQPASAPNGAAGSGGAGGSAGRTGGAANPGGGTASSNAAPGRTQGGSGSGAAAAAAAGGAAGSAAGGAANPAPQNPAPQQPAPQNPAPQQPASQNPAPPPAQKPAPTVVVTGPYCGNKSGAYSQKGWFDQGDSGWRSNSGGWSGDGCNGTYTSVPMSGDTKDDGNSVVWTFTLDKVTSCTLDVYIPASGDVKKVGGNPTYYTVQSGSGSSDFKINQASNQGRWVGEGTFQYRGSLSVTLHTRGQDWVGGNKTYAHHAASAMRVTCTP